MQAIEWRRLELAAWVFLRNLPENVGEFCSQKIGIKRRALKWNQSAQINWRNLNYQAVTPQDQVYGIK